MQEAQLEDLQWGPIFRFLRDNEESEDLAQARHVARTADMYSLLQEDGLLYRDAELGAIQSNTAADGGVSWGRYSGHMGVKMVADSLMIKYYFPNMIKQVNKVIRSYVTCALYREGGRRRAPLCPIRPVGPFHCVQLARNTYSSSRMYVPGFQLQCQRHSAIRKRFPGYFGIRSSVSVGPQRNSYRIMEKPSSANWSVCCVSSLGSNRFSIPYRPQTMGLVERMNQTIIGMLRTQVADSGKEWDKCLPSVIFAYRAAVHVALGDSPFHLVYDRDAVLPIDLLMYGGQCPEDKDEQFIWGMSRNFQELWNLAHEHPFQAQDQFKTRFDLKADKDRVRQGDVVLKRIHLQNTGEIRKLAPKFTAGCRVVAVNPPNATIVPLS